MRRHLRVLPMYDCAKMCGRRRGEPGNLRARAAMRCSLPDFDPAAWDARAHRDAAATAAELLDHLRYVAEELEIDIEHDLDTDGCPWGWVVSRWATGVAAYLGTRSPDGGRSLNPLMLARLVRGDAPPDLVEWVRYLEALEGAAWGRFYKLQAMST